MNESGHIPTADIAPSNSGMNEEAMKIIEEASTIVEESMKDKFPDLPSPCKQAKQRPLCSKSKLGFCKVLINATY